jgi:hypothetical protein
VALGNELLEVRSEEFEFGVARVAGQLLRLGDQLLQSRVVAPCGRLDVVVGQGVGGAIEDPILELVVGPLIL